MWTMPVKAWRAAARPRRPAPTLKQVGMLQDTIAGPSEKIEQLQLAGICVLLLAGCLCVVVCIISPVRERCTERESCEITIQNCEISVG